MGARFPNGLFCHCTNSLSSLHTLSHHCTFCASLHVKTSPALCDDLSAYVHISKVLESCARSLYAPCILRSHGMPAVTLKEIAKATTMARLLYAASAWWGFAHRRRLWGGSPGTCTPNNREMPMHLSLFTTFCPPIFWVAQPIFLTSLRQWLCAYR